MTTVRAGGAFVQVLPLELSSKSSTTQTSRMSRLVVKVDALLMLADVQKCFLCLWHHHAGQQERLFVFHLRIHIFIKQGENVKKLLENRLRCFWWHDYFHNKTLLLCVFSDNTKYIYTFWRCYGWFAVMRCFVCVVKLSCLSMWGCTNPINSERWNLISYGLLNILC